MSAGQPAPGRAPVHSLVVSTADWDRPVWTNKQHVARELAAAGPVTYLNSIGLRRPQLSRADLARIARRAAPGPAPAPRPAPGVLVRSPLVVPWHRRRSPVWRLNRASLRRTVRPWLGSPRGSRVLWTFSPVTYELETAADLVVYHSVDFLEGFGGVDAVALREGEATLARVPGLVALASSRPIAERLRERGFARVELWENVADAELIEATARERRPRDGHLVFAGNLSAQKVDFALLRRLVTTAPNVHLHLAGPIAEGGGEAPDLDWFRRHPRVEIHGTLAPEPLAALLGDCTVGLIPYLRTPYTEGVFPMKVYEYLAAGLAVVSTKLPALAGIDAVRCCATDEEFVGAAVEESGTADETVRAARGALAHEHSWRRRGEQIRELLATGLERS